MDTEDSSFLLGFVVGVIFYICFFIFSVMLPIQISHETGNEVCSHLTNQSGVIASVENDKLVCEVPSFDSTDRIIVRKNGERK